MTTSSHLWAIKKSAAIANIYADALKVAIRMGHPDGLAALAYAHSHSRAIATESQWYDGAAKRKLVNVE